MARNDEDLSRLPKWAQQRIATLEANVEHARKQAYEAAGAHLAGTNTFVRDYVNEDRGLPNNTVVCFRLGPHYDDVIAVHVELEAGRPYLRVRSHGTRIHITPYACNTITVKGSRL